MVNRSEFTTLTKLKAMMRYAHCPGVIELGRECGKKLGSLSETDFDHIKRCEIEPDNSADNCRPLCKECHKAKTKLDAKQAAKGRRLRGENKPKRKHNWPSGKLRSRNTLTKQARDEARAWKERQNG